MRKLEAAAEGGGSAPPVLPSKPWGVGESTFPRHFQQRKRGRIATCDDFAKQGVLLAVSFFSQGSDVKDDRYRPVIHDLHDHSRPEDACLDRDAEATEGLAEPLVKRLRDLGRAAPEKSGRVPF